MTWRAMLNDLPLIAILRGLTPAEATGVARALHEGGLGCLEVPLNSPEPLKSIGIIREAFDGRLLVGAGTVLRVEEVDAAAEAGAQFIVAPNTDRAVIEAAKRRGLHSLPGFFTPTEGLAALHAGADALKLFPAEGSSPAHLKAMKAVLPPNAPVFAVGGVNAAAMPAWLAAGAAGFGLGGALYRPGDKPAAVEARTRELIGAFRSARP